MARTKKPIEVDVYKNTKLNVEIPIYLDSEKNFTATFAGEHVKEATAAALHTLLRKKVEAAAQITWEQIIVVSLPDAFELRRFDAAVAFDFDRHEVAWVDEVIKGDHGPGSGHRAPDRRKRLTRTFRPGGVIPPDMSGMAERGADVTVFHGSIAAAVIRGEHRTGEEKVFELPYSDEAWAALGLIAERLKRAHSDLTDLLRHADLASQLKAIGAAGSTKLLSP